MKLDVVVYSRILLRNNRQSQKDVCSEIHVTECNKICVSTRKAKFTAVPVSSSSVFQYMMVCETMLEKKTYRLLK